MRRYVASIAAAHKALGRGKAAKSVAVRLALKRMHRRRGRRQAQARGLTWPLCQRLLAAAGARPGRTGRYWVSLTKDPEADVLVYPKLNTEAMAALEVTKGPLPFPKDQWSYALDVDVTVNAGAALGTYTVTHTMDLHNNDVEVSDVTELTFTVPAVTVKVAASTSVTGPAPVSATVSGRDASVRFDAPLDASFAPSAADFAVLADGRRLAVTGTWTAGRALLLELAEPATGAVRLAYVPSAAAPLGGRDGSPVPPFETLALAGELADDAPDTLTADVEPKLEGAPGLEAALADALRHAPGPVAATLAAPQRAVKDLTGLGAVPQLRRVNLADNAVTDAGPLALLGDLERLDLSGNAVEDLWPLSGLAELRVLDLSGNRVTDVTALAGLPRLRALELSDNAVVDLSPLGALPALEYLGVAGNRVTDVTALADLHALTRLDLGGNAVVDAAPLGDVGRLVWLRLSGNRLATLDGLGRLTMLRWGVGGRQPAAGRRRGRVARARLGGCGGRWALGGCPRTRKIVICEK